MENRHLVSCVVHKGRSLGQAALSQLVKSMVTISLSGFVASIISPSTVGSFGGGVHMNFREGSFEKNYRFSD